MASDETLDKQSKLQETYESEFKSGIFNVIISYVMHLRSLGLPAQIANEKVAEYLQSIVLGLTDTTEDNNNA